MSHRHEQLEAELRRIEEQLWRAQKLEAIGQLAGGVAHDFNNLLTVQLGYCDLLQQDMAEDDPRYDDLAQVRACAERGTSLTGQLLAISRRQDVEPRVINLNDVVDGLEGLLQRVIGEDIELRTHKAADLGPIEADPGQVEQVMLNLTVNARDAMRHGGTLTIETRNAELGDDFSLLALQPRAGPHAMLMISDTGHGMEATELEHIFEPFYTTKAAGHGTGLGLATVYGIVKQADGNIWVYSEPGVGTSFKIYWPRVHGTPVEAEVLTPELVRIGTRRVLVVEDDASLRNLLARMTEHLGHHVDVAENGVAALRRVADGNLNPELLITDVVMPEMGGATLAEQLAEIRPDLRVLYTSGYTDKIIVHHGVLKAGTSFLQKPFTRRDLAEKISEVFA